MEESRRRAYIKQQAAKKKHEGSLPPKVTGQANPSAKRKPSEKVDRPPKNPKMVAELTVGEIAATSKLPPKPGPGKRMGLMTGVDHVTEKRLILLHEDSGYALKQLSSIIQDNDYEDLGNHATKAMGEMGLFSLVHVCFSILCPLFLPIVVLF